MAGAASVDFRTPLSSTASGRDDPMVLRGLNHAITQFTRLCLSAAKRLPGSAALSWRMDSPSS